MAKLESVITPSISNEVLYQYGRELEDEGLQPLSAYDKANLVGTNGNVPEVALDTSIGFNLGIPYYSYRVAYPSENKWQVGDSVYYVKSNHTFKFGVDMVHNYDFTNVLNNDPNGYIPTTTSEITWPIFTATSMARQQTRAILGLAVWYCNHLGGRHVSVLLRVFAELRSAPIGIQFVDVEQLGLPGLTSDEFRRPKQAAARW